MTDALSRPLTTEDAAEGLRAINVQPGFVATERVELPRGPVAHSAAHPDDFESGSTIRLQGVAKSLDLL